MIFVIRDLLGATIFRVWKERGQLKKTLLSFADSYFFPVLLLTTATEVAHLSSQVVHSAAPTAVDVVAGRGEALDIVAHGEKGRAENVVD